jgi:predicted RNase H-like nuclease
MSVVGVDIFRGGWVAVELVDGEVARAHVAEHIGGIVAEFSSSQVICIDIPIGLVAGGYRGMKARIDVLAGVGIEIPSDLGVASAVPPDDILDAAASAVAADRIARGAGSAVPDTPTQRDVTSGRAIQIWY